MHTFKIKRRDRKNIFSIKTMDNKTIFRGSCHALMENQSGLDSGVAGVAGGADNTKIIRVNDHADAKIAGVSNSEMNERGIESEDLGVPN